jgi:hypothetical protein
MLHLLPLLVPLFPFATAQGTVQDLWIFPKAPDYTSELTVNTTIQIRWHEELQAVFEQFCTLCDTTNVDLWVTGSQYSEAVGGMYTPPYLHPSNSQGGGGGVFYCAVYEKGV